MRGKAIVGVLSAFVLAGVGYLAFAWRSAISPVARPAAASFPADQIARGEKLAGAGFCATCHTAKGGPLNAGGLPMDTPVGKIYTSNITPDEQTGIGRWSLDAFRRAMHEGIARDGSHLLPAFPYNHFTLATDQDIADVYAFIMSRPAVSAVPPQNTIPLEPIARLAMAGWNLLFLKEGRYVEDKTQDAQWNRGAYLSESFSHCSSCHTPRDLLMAESKPRLYDGAIIDNWVAPALNAKNPAAASWGPESFYNYLRKGAAPLHGVSAGPMAPVVHDGLALLPDSDIKAIAAYFASKTNPDSARDKAAVEAALARDARDAGALKSLEAASDDQTAVQKGERLYATGCASCHYNNDHVQEGRPDLGLSTSVALDDPNNLVMALLKGIGANEGSKGLVMPAFGDAWSNADIAAVAAYLRASRGGGRKAWPDLEKKVADARAFIAKQK